jgi:hypothetical protein
LSKIEADTAQEERVSALNGRSQAAIIAAWLIPGSGHLMLGKRVRALVFFLVIMTAITVGCLLEGNLHRILPNQPLTILATLGSMGSGAPYLALRFLLGYQGNVVAPGYEYGSAFMLTAGLMNLLLVLDVFDIGRGRKS